MIDAWIKKIMQQDAEVLACMRVEQNNLLLHIYIQPNASANEIIGLYNECLKIRISAPALEEKANKMLCEFLANQFSVPKSNVSIIKGANSRRKTVMIKNIKI